MHVLLISTYEMGRQPFGLASPAAWLREAGFDVTAIDTTRGPLDEASVRDAGLVGFYLPMHTATRLALSLVGRVRAWNPTAHICGYGLYAPLNRDELRTRGFDSVLGGEFEPSLTALARRLREEPTTTSAGEEGDPPRSLPRVAFKVPDRQGLPPLERYAQLEMGDGTRRVVGYTEASRGCKHACRHCPVVVVYGGQFRIVPRDVVLADVRAQVAAGATHITFGDPDFFNGVRHAVGVVEGLARDCPGVTYDVTIKVEHLIKHRSALPTLAATGCRFVTSAVESVDDHVLRLLDKGHTRADFERSVELCRRAGVPLAPTFVAFTPWLTLRGYCELLQAIAALDLVDHVAPIQLAIRLLVPGGSRLLEIESLVGRLGAFDPQALAYPWRHPDPRVDALQAEVIGLVERRAGAGRREVFGAIFELAHRRAGLAPAELVTPSVPSRAVVPYLNEPWYC